MCKLIPMDYSSLSVTRIQQLLLEADDKQLAAMQKALAYDERSGVQTALKRAEKRAMKQQELVAHTQQMYDYQNELAQGQLCIGLDEVGRGPLAGPLTVAAVLLPAEPLILGLDDSKKLSAAKREELASQIHQTARALSIQHVSPEDIDCFGMTSCLCQAFAAAVADIDSQGFDIPVILLDGNPLGFDAREVNVVKGDGACASIAAASIVAKVARDQLMVELAQTYPAYGFDRNKGYGVSEHIEAIIQHGLSPVHRKSFCAGIQQPTLFRPR